MQCLIILIACAQPHSRALLAFRLISLLTTSLAWGFSSKASGQSDTSLLVLAGDLLLLRCCFPFHFFLFVYCTSATPASNQKKPIAAVHFVACRLRRHRLVVDVFFVSYSCCCCRCRRCSPSSSFISSGVSVGLVLCEFCMCVSFSQLPDWSARARSCSLYW